MAPGEKNVRIHVSTVRVSVETLMCMYVAVQMWQMDKEIMCECLRVSINGIKMQYRKVARTINSGIKCMVQILELPLPSCVLVGNID